MIWGSQDFYLVAVYLVNALGQPVVIDERVLSTKGHIHRLEVLLVYTPLQIVLVQTPQVVPIAGWWLLF